LHIRCGVHEVLAETELAAWFVGQIGQLYGVEKKLREQMPATKITQIKQFTLAMWAMTEAV